MKRIGTKTYLLLASGIAAGALLMAAIQSGNVFSRATAQRPVTLRAAGNVDEAGLDTLKTLDSAFSAISDYALQSTVHVFSENAGSRGANGRLSNVMRGEGSGFIYRADGYIITNDHVVNGFSKVTVTLADGKEYEAKVLTAEDSDIAVLKIEAANLPALPMANSNNVRPGQYSIAVGAPFGLENSVTIGHISAIGRPSQVPDSRSPYGARYYPDMIQTDAAINMGNSGGPLINIDGEVVGVNTAIFSRTGENVGIGFAIPSNQVKLIADTLIEKGKITRGFLGLAPTNLKPYQKKEMNIAGGALVQPFEGLAGPSPAKDAGIQGGDVVVRIGSINVSSEMDLRNAMLKYGPGETVEVEVIRSGQHKTFKVKLIEGPAQTTQQPEDMPQQDRRFRIPDLNFDDLPNNLKDFEKQFGQGNGRSRGEDVEPLRSGPARLGVGIDSITETLRTQFNIPANVKGAVVTAVEPGSVAEKVGLKPGDVLTMLGDKQIHSAADVAEAMKSIKWGDSRRISYSRFGKDSALQSSRDVTFR